jgi:hypothetical protein
LAERYWNSAIEHQPSVASGSATSAQLPNHSANPSSSRLPYPSLPHQNFSLAAAVERQSSPSTAGRVQRTACIVEKLTFTSEWKVFHSMAYNGFRLRKSCYFSTIRRGNLVSTEMAKQ